MLAVISPAKSQDFTPTTKDFSYTIPKFCSEAMHLVSILSKNNIEQISQLMHVSEKIAKLNYDRFKSFSKDFNIQNSKQAIFAYDGDVYDHLNARELSLDEIEYAQNHLGIISGLYGFLKPLDLIQPYRLEMSTPVINEAGKNLYKFWQEKISTHIMNLLSSHNNKTLINLASEEYFSVLDNKIVGEKILNIEFKEFKNGAFKIIGIQAKKARGMMARYIIINKIEKTSDLKNFSDNGYKYNPALSQENKLVFTK
jgi:uncharacterized protein